MPPINILIKPASSACNMACQYCFYKDVAAHREQEFEGMLSIESIEKVIQAGMEYAEHICSFAFQGGEPTLAGLDFYRQVVVLQKQYAKPGVEIRNAIQTNGYTIDEEWAAFFKKTIFWWDYRWTDRQSCITAIAQMCRERIRSIELCNPCGC